MPIGLFNRFARVTDEPPTTGHLTTEGLMLGHIMPVVVQYTDVASTAMPSGLSWLPYASDAVPPQPPVAQSITLPAPRSVT